MWRTEKKAAETEKDGRSGERQRERNDAGLCLNFYEPVACLNELCENSTIFFYLRDDLEVEGAIPHE